MTAPNAKAAACRGDGGPPPRRRRGRASAVKASSSPAAVALDAAAAHASKPSLATAADSAEFGESLPRTPEARDSDAPIESMEDPSGGSVFAYTTSEVISLVDGSTAQAAGDSAAAAEEEVEVPTELSSSAVPTPQLLRPAVSSERLRENVQIRREVAEARQRARNRLERHREEAEFWRRSALGLQVRLAEMRSAAYDDGDAGAAGPVSGAVGLNAGIAAAAAVEQHREEIERRRYSRRRAERRLEAMQARVALAKDRLARGRSTSQQLREQLSQQAVGHLTQPTATPAQTFATSMAKLNTETLMWVRHQIDLRQQSAASGTRAVANNGNSVDIGSLNVTAPAVATATATPGGAADAVAAVAVPSADGSQQATAGEKGSSDFPDNSEAPRRGGSHRRGAGRGRGADGDGSSGSARRPGRGARASETSGSGGGSSGGASAGAGVGHSKGGGGGGGRSRRAAKDYH